MDYNIVNIVANTKIEQKLDLNKLNHELDNCEYEPDVYFALIHRFTNPKLSILINRSGKIIFTGAKSIKDIENVRNKFYNELELLGYHPIKNEISITNIVTIATLGRNIDIDKIARSSYMIDFNPETFPGLILKNKNPKFTSQIFNNGKFTIIGLKRFEDIEPAIDSIKKIIEDI